MPKKGTHSSNSLFSRHNAWKARTILDLYNDMKQRIPEIIRSQYTVQAIDAIFSRPIFSATDFSANSGIPKRSALSDPCGSGQGMMYLKSLRREMGARQAVTSSRTLIGIMNGDVRQA